MLNLTDLDREEIEMFDEPARLRALMEHLGERDPMAFNENSRGHYGEGYTYDRGREEYAVLTEDEADNAWDAALESYIEDAVLYEMPKHLRPYFDRESWKRDARVDGRAHSLSSYDGNEETITDPETGEEFVVFRIN